MGSVVQGLAVRVRRFGCERLACGLLGSGGGVVKGSAMNGAGL